ncbi:hypothetical protein ALC57_15846 [Trachymyrmex cornetzi]|uniref:Uncharacterized protein n=1 Tax=Trachymyrmex cornetzi TaxID=471704 RepID=A0A151IW38_9HYME|nr:hypothetical protein ALC57_15846 [Trachymyrmex cornetzi]
MQAKQNTGPRVVRIGMIKGKESPAIGRRVIKTSRYPLAPDEDVRRLTRTMNTRFTSGEKIAVERGEGGRTREGGGKKKRKYKVVPSGEKTAVVFPSEVEDEDKRDRSQKTDRERGARKRKSTDNDNRANKTSTPTSSYKTGCGEKVVSSWKERDERTYNLHKIKRDRVVRIGGEVGEEKEKERKRERERDPRGHDEGGGKVDRGLSHYACSEETTGLDAGTAAIDS